MFIIRWLYLALAAVVTFIGRLLRDAWLDAWRSFRPTVIRLVQGGVVVLLLFLSFKWIPEVTASVLAVVGFGATFYYFFVRPMLLRTGRKKKK